MMCITYALSFMLCHLCCVTYVVSLMLCHLCCVTYAVSLMLSVNLLSVNYAECLYAK
jgi:hypothetical protein